MEHTHLNLKALQFGSQRTELNEIEETKSKKVYQIKWNLNETIWLGQSRDTIHQGTII